MHAGYELSSYRVFSLQNRSLERIHIEFNQFEMALKKRMSAILQRVEEEV